MIDLDYIEALTKEVVSGHWQDTTGGTEGKSIVILSVAKDEPYSGVATICTIEKTLDGAEPIHAEWIAAIHNNIEELLRLARIGLEHDDQ